MAKKYGAFEPSDKARFLEIIKDGFAAYIYCENVFARGELCELSDGERTYRTIAVQSKIHLPIIFFEKHLGCETAIGDESASLKLGGREAELKISSGKEENTAKMKEGALYIPAEFALEALGISYAIFDNSRLIALGDDKMVSEMKANPALGFAAEMAIFGEYEPEKFTDADFKAAKDKWREKLVGNPEINSSQDAATKEKIALVNKKAKNALDLYNPAPDRIIFFGNEPASTSAHLTRQYSHLGNLGLAYATYGSEYYHDERVKDIVLEGAEWLYANLYGEAEINGTGWRNIHEFNWWDWHVGAADPLTDLMLAMEEFFTDEMKARYLKCHLHCCTFMRVGPDRSFASSRIKIYTKEALLLGDRKMLYDEYIDYDILLDIYYSGEGMHPDFVHWTHGMPYNLTYGVIDLERLLYTGSILAGTPLEFKNPKQYNLFDKLRFCYEPAIFRGMAFGMFRGRAISGSEYSSGAEIIAEIIPLLGMFGEEEDEYIRTFIKRNTADDEMIMRARKYCSLVDLSKLEDILRDKAEPPKYVYAHSWYTGDRAAQQMGDYALALSICSEREPNYESINGENKTGWYTDDGALYLYTNRDRHSFDGANFINCEGVAYKIPGTTVDMRPREKKTLSRAWRMPRDFVGTMSESGLYIVGTIDYESYNFNGPHQGIPDTDHGGSLPFHDNDLVAKKSYFMFDKECLCLGAGINSTMNSPVITTLEHRRVLQNEGDTVSADGKLLCGESFKYTGKAKYIHREGVGGFIVSYGADVVIERYRDESEKDKKFYREIPSVDYDWEHQDYIYALINHGENPTNAKYEYTVLPMASLEETKIYSEKPEINVISNTPALQAAEKPSLGITFAVFHEPGEIEAAGIKLATDTPILLSVKKLDGKIKLRVSDPTQKREKITLTLSGEYEICDKALEISSEIGGGKTTLTVNSLNSIGAPFEAIIKA